MTHTKNVQPGTVVKLFGVGGYRMDAVLTRVLDVTSHAAWLAGTIDGVTGHLAINALGDLYAETSEAALGLAAGGLGVWLPAETLTVTPNPSYFTIPGTATPGAIPYQGTYLLANPYPYPRGCLGVGSVAVDGTADLLLAHLSPGSGVPYLEIVTGVPRAVTFTPLTEDGDPNCYQWIM